MNETILPVFTFLLIREEPPTKEEVKQYQYWWNFPLEGKPHIIQLDVDEQDRYIWEGDYPFSPGDYPGRWAPCIPPSK